MYDFSKVVDKEALQSYYPTEKQIKLVERMVEMLNEERTLVMLDNEVSPPKEYTKRAYQKWIGEYLELYREACLYHTLEDPAFDDMYDILGANIWDIQ